MPPHAHERTSSTTNVKTTSIAAKLLSKGKIKEEEQWQPGWWDMTTLVDGVRRPVYWSGASVIFTSHPSQPEIVCTIYPSLRRFTIKPPQSVSILTYNPPSIIIPSPHDDWLFTYYPGKFNTDVACIYRRGPPVDFWVVKEQWTVTRGKGIVAAQWLGPEREWYTDKKGSQKRRPPKGPAILYSLPVLLYVTESHNVCLRYFHPQNESLQELSASLLRATTSLEQNMGDKAYETSKDRFGLYVCTNAAIGLGYNTSSILIAMHSRRVPPMPTTDSSSLDLDSSLQSAMFDDHVPFEWERWGDDTKIHLCEVRIAYEDFLLALRTNPMPPTSRFAGTGKHITELLFVADDGQDSGVDLTMQESLPHPTSSPLYTHAKINSSPGKAHKGHSRTSSKASSIALTESRAFVSEKLYLVATLTEFGDYLSLPKSEAFCLPFTFNRESWCPAAEIKMTLPPVTFMIPYHAIQSGGPGLLIGVLEKPSSPKRPDVKARRVLLRSMEFDAGWEASYFTHPTKYSEFDFIPFSAAISPNNLLIVVVSPGSLTKTQIYTYSMPRRRQENIGPSNQLVSKTPTHSVSHELFLSILRKIPPGDIGHELSLTSTPIYAVRNVLSDLLASFADYPTGLKEWLTRDAIGLAIDVYRIKEASSDVMDPKRWITGQEICAIATVNTAWDDCTEGGGYELDAVWQLIGVSGWFLAIVEKVLKLCVLWEEEFSPIENDGSHPRSEDPEYWPSPLLHLVHPFALKNFLESLSHVRRFNGFLRSLSARSENSRHAQETLVDLVDTSGINLEALEGTLMECIEAVENLPASIHQRNLAFLCPGEGMRAVIENIAKKITSPTVVTRSKLFIKLDKLVDGVQHLTLSGPSKAQDFDIITKGYLRRPSVNVRLQLHCLRCTGESRLPYIVKALRWNFWERSWSATCVCGGLWSSRSATSGADIR